MANLWLVLLLLLPLCSCEFEQNWTFVGGKTRIESDNGECIFAGPEYPCHTLKYATDRLVELASNDSTASIAIRIIGLAVPLNDTIRFTNASNVQLTGEDTQIVCGSNGAGFVFSSVHGIHIAKLIFKKCGTNNLTAAIHIDNCMDVTIQNVKIESSIGIGLEFSNTYGDVNVSNTGFISNGRQRRVGAVYVEFTNCPLEKYHLGINISSNYTFLNCTFLNNSRGVPYSTGGGLTIIFKGKSCCNNITVVRGKFRRNKANWGGGLYIHFAEQAYNNSVTILRSKIFYNRAESAGGGIDIGYLNNYTSPFKNRIFVKGTAFNQNRANYGGGTAVFAYHSTIPSQPGDTIRFDYCTWSRNSAGFSSSVDISPVIYDTLATGFLPIPVFTNCNFSGNALLPKKLKGRTKVINEGSFTVTKFTVQFGQQIIFTRHKNLALHVISGTVIFQPGTQALFSKNYGTNGGAIALYGFSSLKIHSGCHLQFISNTALEVGGAIYYHSFDQHDFVSTRACFIQFMEPHIQNGSTCENVKKFNVTLEFKNNKAHHGGTSIYALSFFPCFYSFPRNRDVQQSFKCRAHFEFDKPLESAIATAGRQFNFNRSEPIYMIPGKKHEVPLSITDELDNMVHAVYRIETEKFQAEHMHTARGEVRLYGEPGQKGNISFSVLNFREISFKVQVALLQCPPGFFLHDSRCKCSALFQEHAYLGIEKCNYPDFEAYVMQGYWAGYLESSNETPESLFTAPCPLGFCSYEQNTTKLYLLPKRASRPMLSEFMCDKYRKGVLCGECADGRSAYFHSQHYRCGEGNYCQFGLLFYFISELIPLTILFTVVIVFDIQFTSGTFNGFIFFCQVLDSLSVDANGVIQFPSPVDKLSIGYKVIYGLFNFDFFSIESLSFCLWKQATVLDILAFKYITTVFAFGLVMCLVCTIQHCQCKRICALKKKVSTRDSAIHGLSTFLVMCYAQCTKVSFQILTSITLTGKGGTPGPQVSRFGGVPYFQGKHLAYAIPACICLTTIVVVPPLLLIIFPLFLQLLALCGLSESRGANWVSLHIWTFKLKPLLDSVQACFKDKLRFFAGLYFVYRVTVLAVYAFSKTAIHFYITVEVLLILMLGLHALAHPYKKRQHNVLDALIFINLALINAFTTFTYVHRSHSGGEKTLHAVLWLQMILSYLPIVCLCSFLVAITIKKGTQWKARATEQLQLQEELQQIDSLIEHERLPYQEFESAVSEVVEQESL